MLGVLLSQILGISRMMFAMGRRKDLFPIFERIHKNTLVPHFGVLITGLLICLLTLFGKFEIILSAAAFTILLYYSITNIAALNQPEAQQRYGKVVPLFGLTGCLIMAFSLDFLIIITGISILMGGFILRWILYKIHYS